MGKVLSLNLIRYIKKGRT